ENAVSAENTNVFTSIWNTAVATAATVAKGSTSVLRVGTGAAQGVEDIKRGFGDNGDGMDIAIGVLRIVAAAGDVAGAATGAAGSAAKAGSALRAASASKKLRAARAAGASAEEVGELAARVEASKAGLQPAKKLLSRDPAGNAKRLANDGPVAQGVDQAY